MSTLTLATGPVSWGVDFADAATNPPWELVLDEVARSPLDALELGPVGYLPEDPEALREALDERGLTAVGTFLFDALHDPSRRAEILAGAARTAAVVAAASGRVLVIIDRPSGERARTAGRSEAAPRMADEDWTRMVDLVDEVAAIAASAGLRPVFHPHAGSWVEFADEVERLLASSAIDLCLDLGHSSFAGIDPARAIEAWAPRIGHLHLKDVDPAVLARVVTHQLDFWEAVGADVFCPLGDGMVDLARVAEQLAAIGYRGYATIEQDRVPGGGEPLADLRRSVDALARAGFPIAHEARTPGGGG